MLYIKTKKLTKKEQDLCGLQGIFFLFNCQTPVKRIADYADMKYKRRFLEKSNPDI